MDDEGHADTTASPPRGGVRRKALGDKRCIETLLHKIGCARHSSSKLGFALTCTIFAPSGRICGGQPTQGDAQGDALVAPSGCTLNACCPFRAHLRRTTYPGRCPGLCACWAFSPLLERLLTTSEYLRNLKTTYFSEKIYCIGQVSISSLKSKYIFFFF